MSFVKTLATLAAGYAAARGVDHFRKMGGMEGVQKAMKDNPMLANAQDQIGGMMEKLGIPGGADALKNMMGPLTGGNDAAAAGAASGLGGLMSALSGGAATGAEQSGKMIDALTGTTAATAAMEENAKLMIRAMIQAAKADGEIDDDEKARILEHVGDVDAEERAFIQAELSRPIDVAGLAAETDHAMRGQVYAMSVMAVRVDHPSEAQYLNTLAAALGLSEADRARIHSAMGLG